MLIFSVAKGLVNAGKPKMTFKWLSVVFPNCSHSVHLGDWTPCQYSSTLLYFCRGVK